MRVKLRKAEPGRRVLQQRPALRSRGLRTAEAVRRAAEYVVPPTALRMIPPRISRNSRRMSSDVPARGPGAGGDPVLAHDVIVVADVYDPVRFAGRSGLRAHIGQLNVLTYLIGHRDSNVGNFLIGKADVGRACLFDRQRRGIRLDESDRGELWKDLRVHRLPADTVARLRQITPAPGSSGSACWRNGSSRTARSWASRRVPNLVPVRGVRRDGDVAADGADAVRDLGVQRRCGQLLERIDRRQDHARSGTSDDRDRHCAIPSRQFADFAAWPPRCSWPSPVAARCAPPRRAVRCSGPASNASSPSPTCTAPTRSWLRCCVRPAWSTRRIAGLPAPATWSASATCSIAAPIRARSWTC